MIARNFVNQFEYSNIDLSEVDIERQQEEVATESLNVFTLMPGIKLPKSNEQWIEPNTYFHSIFAYSQVPNKRPPANQLFNFFQPTGPY